MIPRGRTRAPVRALLVLAFAKCQNLELKSGSGNTGRDCDKGRGSWT